MSSGLWRALAVSVLLGGMAAFAQEPVPGGEEGAASTEEIPEPTADPQAEGAVDELTPPPATEEPAPPVAPPPLPALPERSAWEEDVARDYLAALAEARPGLARLEILGRSRAGREIPLLVVGPPVEPGAMEGTNAGPSLLFAAHRGRESAGAGAALAVARRAVEVAELVRAGPDEGAAGLFERVTLYVAPLLDPDAGDAGADFDRDFPIGWLPGSLRPGAAEIPLSRPATLAAARFLEEHPGLALVLAPVDANRAGGRPWPQAELPAADARVLELLTDQTGPAPLVGWNSLSSPGGGFLDHAYQAHGVLPLALPEPTGEASERWARAVAERVLDLARRLPEVTVREEHLERLGPTLWRLDAVLANRGGLPSQSALAGGRTGAAGELRLVLRGARVLATARGEGAESARYRVAEPSVPEGREAFVEAPLGPGEERRIRFVVRGEAGDQVELRASTSRAGQAVLRIPLR